MIKMSTSGVKGWVILNILKMETKQLEILAKTGGILRLVKTGA